MYMYIKLVLLMDFTFQMLPFVPNTLVRQCLLAQVSILNLRLLFIYAFFL